MLANAVKIRSNETSLLSADGHEPLAVKQFVKHVMELHNSNTFSREFEVNKVLSCVGFEQEATRKGGPERT